MKPTSFQFVDDPKVYLKYKPQLDLEREFWNKNLGSGEFDQRMQEEKYNSYIDHMKSKIEVIEKPTIEMRIVMFFSSKVYDMGYLGGLTLFVMMYGAVVGGVGLSSSLVPLPLYLSLLSSAIPSLFAPIAHLLLNKTLAQVDVHFFRSRSVFFVFILRLLSSINLSSLLPSSSKGGDEGKAEMGEGEEKEEDLDEIESDEEEEKEEGTKNESKSGDDKKKKSKRRRKKVTVKWHCMVCNRANKGKMMPGEPFPTRARLTVQMRGDFIYYLKIYLWIFSVCVLGKYVVRKVAVMVSEFDGPRCSACDTPFNYVPRNCANHIFDRNPRRLDAFSDYPREDKFTKAEDVSALEKWQLYANRAKNILLGIDGSMEAPILEKDWRMKFYLRDKIPTVEREKKHKKNTLKHPSMMQDEEKGYQEEVIPPVEQCFRDGDFVECRLQKSATWTRGRVTSVNITSQTVDIEYEDGNLVRFVPPQFIRFPPIESSSLRSLIELSAYLTLLLFPVFAQVTYSSSIEAGAVLMGAPLLLLALLGIGFWTFKFVQTYARHWEVGLLFHLKLYMYYVFPFLLLLIFSSSLMGGGDPGFLAVMFILSSLVGSFHLFCYKPFFGLLGVIYSVLFSILALITAMYQVQPKVGGVVHPLVPIALLFFILLSLIYLRKWLEHIWEPILLYQSGKIHPSTIENLTIEEDEEIVEENNT